MHGSLLTSSECVKTLLAYHNRLVSEGVEQSIALARTAEHFHVAPHKVSYFIDESNARTLERLTGRPGALTIGAALAHKNARAA